jgi:hypothetical protein
VTSFEPTPPDNPAVPEPAEPPAAVMTRVTLWPNGQITVFMSDDRISYGYSGKAKDVAARLLADAPVEVQWFTGSWATQLQAVTREQFALLCREASKK